MVFGRKSAPVKPKPPGVEEILENLSKAAPTDPLFTLVPSVAKDLIAEEEIEENKRYQEVADYLSCEETLNQLQHKVTEGFAELVASQKELGQVTEEVETQLKNLRKARAQLGVVPEKKVEVLETETPEEDAEDLC